MPTESGILPMIPGNLEIPAPRPSPYRHVVRNAEIRRLVRKLVAMDGQALQLYQPLPVAQQFHECTAKHRIVDGSNRSGKTLSSAAECCRAWLGLDPYDKYPRDHGKSLVVGLDEDHIGMMWEKCAEPGAFSIIRDEHTHQWRAVRPNPSNPLELDPYDEAYREKWKESPPLIPPKMILGRIAWQDRSKGIPRVVRFTTGWSSLWRSSMGKAPQGEHWNLVWIDEHIENDKFYSEGRRGMVGLHEKREHRPRLIWSATPQTSNYQLIDLREKADAGSRSIRAFKMVIDDNPFVPQEEKEDFLEGLSEDERRVRYFGEAAVAGRRIYPTWDPMGAHGCDPFAIPDKYCRYVVLDPGRQHCGTLFAAVDPEEAHVYIYDGFDLRNGDAAAWAREVAKRQYGFRFEAYVIDQQMGKQRPPGWGSNVAQQYFAAVQKAKAEPRQLGPLGGFFPGSNDVSAREEALLGWLTIRGFGPFAGTAKLQLFRGTLPELEKQVRRAHMNINRPDKREILQEDLLVCLEYLAAFDPRYRIPGPNHDTAAIPSVVEQLQKKQKRLQAKRPKAMAW